MKYVLFVCIENVCRSQMAEAFFNKYAKDAIASSAGSRPAKEINPQTVEVMKEAGIDLSGKVPASYAKLRANKFDYVITMGCKEECPITPKEKTVKWDIEDPKGGTIGKFREIREIIREKVKSFIAETLNE